MPLQRNLADLGLCFGVDDRQRAVSVADEDAGSILADANVVSIGAQGNLTRWSEILTLKHPHGAIAGVRDVDRVGGGNVSNALRLAKPGERENQLAAFEVNHADTIVTQFSDIKSMSSDINSEVINSSFDISKGNFCFQG